MMGTMIETVVMAFGIGGIIDTITASHLSSGHEKVPVKIALDRSQKVRRNREYTNQRD